MIAILGGILFIMIVAGLVLGIHQEDAHVPHRFRHGKGKRRSQFMEKMAKAQEQVRMMQQDPNSGKMNLTPDQIAMVRHRMQMFEQGNLPLQKGDKEEGRQLNEMMTKFRERAGRGRDR